MKNRIAQFETLFDKEWFEKHTLALYRMERLQTFPAYQEGAKYIYDLLTSEGFETEYLEFPADGKTCYQDHCISLGWDVSDMKLEIMTAIPGLKDPVIADYQREPLHGVKHSVATPPEGLDVKIIAESQMKAGADVRGALILLDHRTQPRCEAMRMLLDLGAVGWVSDYSEDPHASPDTVYWTNAGTEYGVWHINADERPFISFQISERNGTLLRQACNGGEVKAHIFSDGHRYESALPAVTALLPGKDPREIWVVAHTCEPLVDDNSNGVIASIALLKVMRQLAQAGEIDLKYSIRVVFTSELYGMSAVCEHFGGDLSERTIGGMNLDGFVSSTDKTRYKAFNLYEGENWPGFAGNILLHQASECFMAEHGDYTLNRRGYSVGDDLFFNDSKINMPTIWILHHSFGYHHNSVLDESVMDGENARAHFGFSAQWLCAMASLTAEEIEALLPAAVQQAQKILETEALRPVRPGTDMQARMNFLYNREISAIRQLSLWGDGETIEAAIDTLLFPENVGAYIPRRESTPFYDLTKNFVFDRVLRGLPHDMLCIPKENRTVGYGGMLYQPFAPVFSRMDGKRTLQEAICLTEWDEKRLYSEGQIQKWLHYCILFAQYGYLTMQVTEPMTQRKLKEALCSLGVEAGDTLLVHSALSGIGYIEGGAKAVLGALLDAAGEDGTVLAPAFAESHIYKNGMVNRSYTFRPYDTREDGALRNQTVWTGLLAKTMLESENSFRSGHPTHEWVAMGKNAKAAVAGHGFTDAPTGETSPMKYALEHKGSLIFLGCEPSENLFVHFAAAAAGMRCSEPAVMQYIDREGYTRTAMIDNPVSMNLFEEAQKRGLTIRECSFGLTKLCRIDLKELYEMIQDMI